MTTQLMYLDVSAYGFYGTNNTNSTIGNYTLIAPTLNISAYYIASSQLYGGSEMEFNPGYAPFDKYSDATFLYDNTPYPVDYLEHNGSCQPLGTYQWGFSLLLLFIFLLTLFIWSIGMYVFWTMANVSLQAREIHEIPGEYKAIIGLAATMQREFEKEREDPAGLNEHQITRKIRRDLNGGRIAHDHPITQLCKRHFRDVFAGWFKRERLWLLLFATLTAIWGSKVSSHSPLFIFILSIVTSAGVLAAMFVGQRTGPRVLIVLFFVIVGLTVIFPSVYIAQGFQSAY
jgi:hypothetical protein